MKPQPPETSEHTIRRLEREITVLKATVSRLKQKPFYYLTVTDEAHKKHKAAVNAIRLLVSLASPVDKTAAKFRAVLVRYGLDKA